MNVAICKRKNTSLWPPKCQNNDFRVQSQASIPMFPKLFRFVDHKRNLFFCGPLNILADLFESILFKQKAATYNQILHVFKQKNSTDQLKNFGGP